MATIVQIPDSISLLRNLKSFIISSSSEISFSLKKNDADVVSEIYQPDSDGRIEIDIREVAAQYVSTALPTSDIYEQTSSRAAFNAYVNGALIASFAVFNGGVRKLSDAPVNWLKANWLTWQPQTKRVTWNSPEYLTYYFLQAGSCKAKFYLKDGTTRTVTLGSSPGLQILTFNTSPGRLFGLSGSPASDLYGLVDVWTESGSGTQLSYVQRYICAPSKNDETYYLCVNSLGGIDTFAFHGARTLVPEADHEVAELSDRLIDVTSRAVRKWSQNTGYQGKSCTVWIWELIASRQAWLVENGMANAIVLDTSSVSMSERDNLSACTFTYELAEEGRLLNISRSPSLPLIEVPSPSGELFFLKGRLVDFPDAELADQILFLVQSPYTDSWSKASLSSITAWITNLLNQSGLLMAVHSHDNKSVLDKFSEVDGKPAFSGEKIASQSDLSRFIRKDIPDSADGRITFKDGIQLGESFVPGPTGTGGLVDRFGAAELESLILRSWLEVPELRYNRISIEIGNKWNAPGGGIIEDVSVDLDASGESLMTGIITLHLEDGEFGTVAVDDICHGIYHNVTNQAANSPSDADDGYGNFHFAGFSSCYFRVTEILDARCQRFRYALRGTSARWSRRNHPAAGMHFVGYGNFTDVTRQKSRYSTRTYERFLSGVNDWEFTASNVAAQLGDLANLSVFGLRMEGYSAYLNNIYMTGTIKQLDELPLRLEIDTQGDDFLAFGETLHVTCRVWKGYYQDITDQVTSWSIVRDSGEETDDAAWLLKPKVRDFAGQIDICFTQQENDLGGNANTVSTLFTIRAEIDTGDSASFNLTI